MIEKQQIENIRKTGSWIRYLQIGVFLLAALFAIFDNMKSLFLYACSIAIIFAIFCELVILRAKQIKILNYLEFNSGKPEK